MDTWQTILSIRPFEDYTVVRCDVPEHDESSYVRCMDSCRCNKCGMYDTNWGCPPGFSEDPSGIFSEYSYALLVRRTFCLDVKDKSVVDATTVEMQRIVRMMVMELRSNNMDCRGFSDGGCKYCGTCAYPEPCRFPDMLIPSISALGIDMETYLKSIGLPFSFSDTCMTLYGLILVK